MDTDNKEFTAGQKCLRQRTFIGFSETIGKSRGVTDYWHVRSFPIRGLLVLASATSIAIRPALPFAANNLLYLTSWRDFL